MKQKNLLVFACFFMVYSSMTGNIILVPSAQPTIQAGIDAASNGDTIIVADGTYSGSGNFNINLSGKDVIVKSQNGPENCIIDVQDSVASGFRIDSASSNGIINGFKVINAKNVGIYIITCNPTIINCIVTGCDIGIYSEGHWSGSPGASPTIKNNLVYNNSADGIQAFESGSPIIINNTIVNNGANGILTGFCTSVIKNNIITGNSTGIRWGGDTTIFNTYNDVWNNTTNYDSATAGAGSISADPLFDSNYHLTTGSPCIDAGDPTSPKDPDNTRADMGAYYFDQPTTSSHINMGNRIDMAQVYPNPFSDDMEITFEVARKSNVMVTIYSMDGSMIDILSNKNFEKGSYTVKWDGEYMDGISLPNGIYFCTITIDQAIETRQIVLLK